MLAAEPLYVLVDTAVVGHLGRVPLAALAVGGTVLTLVVWLGTVTAYGTTGRSARRFGAGDRAAAVAEGVQASWLAFAAGLLLLLVAQVAAGPLARTLAGGDPDVAGAAAQWLRIAALGAPGLLLAAAGNGWLRGVQDTRRPLLFVLGPNVLSAALCPLLVYPAGFGLVGSAIANVVAQTLGGVLFVGALVAERVSLRPRPSMIVGQLVLSRDLLVRGAAFQVSFLSATAVAARFGAASVAAHQIALQLWFFTALVLDALAIAAQALVGAALGAGDIAGARALARRVALIGGGCGIALRPAGRRRSRGGAVLVQRRRAGTGAGADRLAVVRRDAAAGRRRVRPGRGADRRGRPPLHAQSHHRRRGRRLPARHLDRVRAGPGAGRDLGRTRAVPGGTPGRPAAPDAQRRVGGGRRDPAERPRQWSRGRRPGYRPAGPARAARAGVWQAWRS